jgi:hypothetical protein
VRRITGITTLETPHHTQEVYKEDIFLFSLWYLSPSIRKMTFVGLLIPGYAVRTDFQALEPTKGVLTLSCPGDLASPLAAIQDIGLFLLPTAQLPPNHGVLCYWQITAAAAAAAPSTPVGAPTPAPAAATGFELLGPMTPQTPSAVFPTGWAEHEQVVEISNHNIPVQVTIAVSIEPLSTIDNLLQSSSSNNTGIPTTPGGGTTANTNTGQRRLFVAQRVAMNLFQYMQSFDAGTGGPGHMVVPTNIFDRWLQRFETKFRRDPNFFLRNND